MNSNFHKYQAEELIKDVNRLRTGERLRDKEIDILIGLAQIHATLATVSDE